MKDQDDKQLDQELQELWSQNLDAKKSTRIVSALETLSSPQAPLPLLRRLRALDETQIEGRSSILSTIFRPLLVPGLALALVFIIAPEFTTQTKGASVPSTIAPVPTDSAQSDLNDDDSQDLSAALGQSENALEDGDSADDHDDSMFDVASIDVEVAL